MWITKHKRIQLPNHARKRTLHWITLEPARTPLVLRLNPLLDRAHRDAELASVIRSVLRHAHTHTLTAHAGA